MMRCTLSAPIPTNVRLFQRLGALFIVVLAGACGDTRASTDTRTNWLSSCLDDLACGSGLSCVCGVCTQSCESGESCGEVNPDAVCVDALGCESAARVCASEGFFGAVTDGSVLDPEDTAAGDDATTEDATTEDRTSSSVISSSSSAASSTFETASDGGSAGSGTTLDGDTSGEGGPISDVSTHSIDGGFCDNPDRDYRSRDSVECASLEIDCGVVAEGIGRVPFADVCGCGCEPYVLPPQSDSLSEGTCADTPPSGTSANFAVLAESKLGDTACDNLQSALLRSASDMGQWASESGCGDVAALMADIDFGSQAVIVVGTPERPSASASYTVQTLDGTIHVGVSADAYCGGARPSSGYVLVTVNALPSTALRVVTETCFATCADDGGLPVP